MLAEYASGCDDECMVAHTAACDLRHQTCNIAGSQAGASQPGKVLGTVAVVAFSLTLMAAVILMLVVAAEVWLPYPFNVLASSVLVFMFIVAAIKFLMEA